jgi:hypothetical protein
MLCLATILSVSAPILINISHYSYSDETLPAIVDDDDMSLDLKHANESSLTMNKTSLKEYMAKFYNISYWPDIKT